MNQQTLQQGSKAYLISIVMVAVLGGLLFGYDTAVISGAEKGLQAFFMEAKDFAYTDGWHGFTSASALIGCIIGSALSGYLATNLGRKKSLIIAGILFFISALGSMDPEFMFFEYGTPTYSLLIMFNIYRVIGGIGVGLASAICPMYIGEVAPSNIRGMLVSWNQFAIIFGQLVVYFVNFFILGDHIQPLVEEMGKGLAAINPAAQWTVTTGWRYMFGSEAVPAGLFALLICFVPETPRYLVSIGQDQKAEGILAKINGTAKAAQILQDIKDTMVVKTEKLLSYGAMCIFIGIMLSVFQQAVGINAVLYYAPRIFGDMGMDNPMMITVFMGIINIDKENQVAEEYKGKMRTKAPTVQQAVGNLSGGNQQKVLLSKWMFADPEVLILDEPTRGIDVGAKYEIYCIMNDLVAQGKSVVMISSEMPELLGMCDRIYVMNEGKMVAEMPAAEATQEKIMSAILQSDKSEKPGKADELISLKKE